MKRKHIIILAVFLLLLFLGTAIAIYWPHMFPSDDVDVSTGFGGGSDEAIATQSDPTKVSPKYRCPLDGEATSEEKSFRRPIAIMIENHVDARPQSSLIKACTVYETVAEGGITRFMAIYVHNDAGTIGPVRSAREYFVDLAKQYDALYAHCGGPAYIYDVIKNLNIADLDEFTNTEAYWRINTRKAPHNLYTSTANLRKRAFVRGYQNDIFYQKPNFKEDDPLEIRPVSASIDINFSRPEFGVHYEYDRQRNTYNRFMGGKPHIDGVFNRQITPKNIIIQFTPISKIANDPKGRMRLSLIGTGRAIVFQDGRAIDATWQRLSLSDLTRFYDTNGAEIKFNRGQTWIELVDEATMPVSYK